MLTEVRNVQNFSRFDKASPAVNDGLGHSAVRRFFGCALRRVR
jgi:hypothetical protein